MKILVATPLYPPETAQIALYSRQVARHLKTNDQVTILTYAYKIDPSDDLDIVTVDKTKPLFIRLAKYSWSLFKLSKTHDVIYVQNALAAGLPAILVKYLTGKPVVVNFYEDEAWKRAFNWHLTEKSWEDFFNYKILDKEIKRAINIQKWTLHHASKVVVNSKYLADMLVNKYKVKRDKIFVNAHPEDRQQKLVFPMGRIPHQIFAAGPLLEWTNMSDIVQAMGHLKNKFSDIKLIIAGSGQDKVKLIKLISKLGLLDKVELLGQISQAEYWYLLKTSAVYIHNFSGIDYQNQISHSLLAKTSVIARDTEINREFLSGVKASLLFSASNIEDLSDKIEQIFTNNNLLEAGLPNVFTWPEHIKRLANILSSEISK